MRFRMMWLILVFAILGVVVVPPPAWADTRAQMVAVGAYHTCAVTHSGGVKCWGANFFGQLGDGTTTDRTTPADVTGLTSGVLAVAAGQIHTCALTTEGGVTCWGGNTFGQLGDGTTFFRTTPTGVVGLASGAAALAAGQDHTCALTTEGGVTCWGGNWAGQLGDGTTIDRATPTPVSGQTSAVAAVAAGVVHTCALTTGGGVTCWGANWAGQLGDGTITDRWAPVQVSGLTSGAAAVAAGESHSCAVIAGGDMQCWGGNDHGQLGDGTTITRATPTAVTGLAGNVIMVAAGRFHTCAVTTEGRMKCWGGNEWGQLGDGTTTDLPTPTDVTGLAKGVATMAAGDKHTCAVTAGGGVRCWGDNDVGQLGDDTWTDRWTPVRARGFGQRDFDGDDVADVAVYRPSTGTWFSLDSSANNQGFRFHGWGMQAHGDVPVLADFDWDGVFDPTVFRPATGTWFVLISSSNYTDWGWLGWGTDTDTPVPGDYDRDEVTDAAVYRPSTGEWFIRPSSGASPWSVVFRQSGDVPIAGDFDGDGRRDVAVYRPSTGTWFWLTSSSNHTHMEYLGWGVQAEGDQPVPGDYDGDGKTDLAVYRPASGTWFILESHAAYTTWSWAGWGNATDHPVPADYDGDGKTDLAIYRPSTGEWWVKPSNGTTPWSVVFGQAGDVPLQGIR